MCNDIYVGFFKISKIALRKILLLVDFLWLMRNCCCCCKNLYEQSCLFIALCLETKTFFPHPTSHFVVVVKTYEKKTIDHAVSTHCVFRARHSPNSQQQRAPLQNQIEDLINRRLSLGIRQSDSLHSLSPPVPK